MSFGLIIGSSTQARLNTGTFILPISSIVQSSGLTQVGNRFVVGEIGPYVISLSMRAAANTVDVQFSVQIFNATAGIVAAQQDLEAPTMSAGEDYSIQLPLTVVSPTDEYEIRVVVRNAENPKLLFLIPPQFTALLQSVFGGAGSAEYAGGQLDSGGGGVPIAPGSFIQFSVNNSYLIRAGRLLGTPPGGTIAVDVLTSTFALYPAFASITGGSPLAFAAGDKVDDTALAGWTTLVPAGSIIRMATIAPPPVITERCSCELLLQRT